MKATQARGYFPYILAMDCETTGLCFGSDDPSYNRNTGEQHQAVSWGFIVADAITLKPIEELYVEIKWNGNSKTQKSKTSSFGVGAEKIHGLSYEHLEENGMDEEEAVLTIGSMILKYWDPNKPIQTLGHNVHTFDLPFLRDLFRRNGIILKFGSRHCDTNSVGFCTVGSFNSDDLFAIMGNDERQEHNALDDAKKSLEAARKIKLLWSSIVDISAYD